MQEASLTTVHKSYDHFGSSDWTLLYLFTRQNVTTLGRPTDGDIVLTFRTIDLINFVARAPNCDDTSRVSVHYIALHRTASHYSAPHCTALHCTTLHSITLHNTAPLFTAPYCNAKLYCAPHCTNLHCITLQRFTLHYTAPLYTAPQCTALHRTTLSSTAQPSQRYTAFLCCITHRTKHHCTTLS